MVFLSFFYLFLSPSFLYSPSLFLHSFSFPHYLLPDVLYELLRDWGDESSLSPALETFADRYSEENACASCLSVLCFRETIPTFQPNGENRRQWGGPVNYLQEKAKKAFFFFAHRKAKVRRGKRGRRGRRERGGRGGKSSTSTKLN